MDFSTALSTLNTELGDGDDFALTADEKTRALTRAWNDSYVVEEVLDETLTYDNADDRYDFPSGVSTIINVYQDPDADSFKSAVPADAYHIVDNKLQIHEGYKNLLTHNKELYLHGWSKLSTTDSITGAELQEYVLMLAQHYCNNALLNKKTFKFLKNDTSVAELIGRNNQLKQEILEYRKQHRVIPQQM